MSFPEQRQNRLDPVLADLRRIPGVECVEQDDFDSSGINVFLALAVANRAGCMTSNTRPWRFVGSLRSIKAAIRRACKQHDVFFSFLDWPVKQYVRNGPGPKSDDGYNHESIKLEILV